MKKKQYYFFLFSFFFSYKAFSQPENIKLFLEPTVAVELSSKLFKLDESDTESYQLDENKSSCLLKFKKSGWDEIMLEIWVEDNRPVPSKDSLEKEMEKQITQLQEKEKILDVSRLDYQGFVGYGFRLDKNTSKEVNTGGIYQKYIDGVRCSIYINSDNNDIPYEQIHNQVIKLIDGIKMLKKADFEQEEKLIKEQVSIYTDSIAKPSLISSIPTNYVAYVTVEGIDSGQISNVIIENQSYSVQNKFEFVENGKVLIFTNDSEKGKITKKCTLTLLDSIGKEVKIPFEFSYYNK